MDEDFRAIVTGDEPVALRLIEPFDRPLVLCHGSTEPPLSFASVRLGCGVRPRQVRCRLHYDDRKRHLKDSDVTLLTQGSK